MKYTDEIGLLTKNADEIVSATKHGETITDTSKYIPWGKWEDYKKVVVNGEECAQIGDFYYRKHAVEEFLNPSIETNLQVAINPNGKKSWVEHSRGVPPSYVDWMLTEGVENGTTIIGQPYIRNGGTHVKYTNGSLEVVLREGKIVYTIFTK